MAEALLLQDNREGTDAVFLIKDNKGRDFIRGLKSNTEVFRINRFGELISTSGYNKRIIHIPLGDIAADSDAINSPLFIANVPITISEIEFSCDATVAPDGTNYQSIIVNKKSGSSGTETAVTAAITTATTGFTAKAWRASGALVSAAAVIAAGESVYLDFTKAASGKILPGFVARIEYSINATATDSNSASDEDLIFNFGEAGLSDGTIISDQTVRDHFSFWDNETSPEKEVFNVSLEGVVSQPYARDRFFIDVINVGDITAAADDAKVSTLFKANGKIQIEKIFVGADTASAADSDSAYETVAILNGTNKISEFTVGGPKATGLALTAGVLNDLGTLNEDKAELASGDVLKVSYTATSSGENISGLTFVIVYRKLD